MRTLEHRMIGRCLARRRHSRGEASKAITWPLRPTHFEHNSVYRPWWAPISRTVIPGRSSRSTKRSSAPSKPSSTPCGLNRHLERATRTRKASARGWECPEELCEHDWRARGIFLRPEEPEIVKPAAELSRETTTLLSKGRAFRASPRRDEIQRDR